MVDPDASVALERIPPIVPEGVDPLVRVKAPDGVGPSLCDQLTIPVARLWSEQRVLRPALRLVDVNLGRDDVVIADQDRRHVAVEQVTRVGLKSIEPGELVVELRAR